VDVRQEANKGHHGTCTGGRRHAVCDQGEPHDRLILRSGDGALVLDRDTKYAPRYSITPLLANYTHALTPTRTQTHTDGLPAGVSTWRLQLAGERGALASCLRDMVGDTGTSTAATASALLRTCVNTSTNTSTSTSTGARHCIGVSDGAATAMQQVTVAVVMWPDDDSATAGRVGAATPKVQVDGSGFQRPLHVDVQVLHGITPQPQPQVVQPNKSAAHRDTHPHGQPRHNHQARETLCTRTSSLEAGTLMRRLTRPPLSTCTRLNATNCRTGRVTLRKGNDTYSCTTSSASTSPTLATVTVTTTRWSLGHTPRGDGAHSASPATRKSVYAKRE